MYVSNVDLPLYNNAFKINPKLDFKAMKQFLKLITGAHDFAGFRANGSETETTVRTIFSASIEKQGEYLIFSVTGNGFLYNMVRIIVGTLIEIGRNKKSLEDLKNLLISSNRAQAGKTVSPDGLYLKEVKY